jgi:hypothetical protein
LKNCVVFKHSYAFTKKPTEYSKKLCIKTIIKINAKYGPNLEGKNIPQRLSLPTVYSPLPHPPLYYTEKSYTKIIAP